MEVRETSSNVIAFFYRLMRDDVTPGRVEEITRQIESASGVWELSNGYIAEYAAEIVERLEK